MPSHQAQIIRAILPLRKFPSRHGEAGEGDAIGVILPRAAYM
jgi:hypothetical protein